MSRRSGRTSTPGEAPGEDRPRGHAPVPLLLLLAVLAAALQAGCKSCFEPPPGPKIQTSPVRGVVRQGRSHEPVTTGQALVVRRADDEHRRVPYSYAYYTADPKTLALVRASLARARPTDPSTCRPAWRLDFLTQSSSETYLANLDCGLVRRDWHFLRLGSNDMEVLQRLFRRAARKPTHRIFFLQVPSTIPETKIRKLLSSRVVRVLPPIPRYRYPHARVSVSLTSPMPEDLTRLDDTVHALRDRARRMLTAVGQALRATRAEVVGLSGPYPIQEDFSNRLTVHWGMTVFFKPGTDELTIRYLVGGLEVSVDEVVVTDYYRLDVLVPLETKMRDMLAFLNKLNLEPKPTLWRHRH